MAQLVQARDLAVLLRPRMTERSVAQQENGIYVFEVAVDADKFAVRRAVEAIFEVDVKSVRVLNSKPKSRRTRYGVGYLKRTRKAYVRVADDQQIDYSKLEG